MYWPARGGRSCERFGGYKTINRILLPLMTKITFEMYYINLAYFGFINASKGQVRLIKEEVFAKGINIWV